MTCNVVLNILTNASKYSEENTVINFRVYETAGELHLEVEDKGIGIPEDEQHHLFERFFRARNAVNIQGTGLGLNIVKKYVEIMGGAISYHSEFGKGSTFLVKFPL
jgi:signal transduction histidine kinase